MGRWQREHLARTYDVIVRLCGELSHARMEACKKHVKQREHDGDIRQETLQASQLEAVTEPPCSFNYYCYVAGTRGMSNAEPQYYGTEHLERLSLTEANEHERKSVETFSQYEAGKEQLHLPLIVFSDRTLQISRN